MNDTLAIIDLASMLGSLWRIVVFGLLIGAGLPAVFALGLRLVSPTVATDGRATTVTTLAHPSVAQRVAAWCCFGVAGVAVVAGIAYIAVGGH